MENIKSRKGANQTANDARIQGLVKKSLQTLEKENHKLESNETFVAVACQSGCSGVRSPSQPSSSCSPPFGAPGSSGSADTESLSSLLRWNSGSQLVRKSGELFGRIAQRFRGLFRRSPGQQSLSAIQSGRSPKDAVSSKRSGAKDAKRLEQTREEKA